MVYSTSYWLAFVPLIFINKYNIQMSWVQSNWTDCRVFDFPERLRPQWEGTLGSEGISRFGVRFDRLQSNLKQRSRSPLQLCGDLTHADTPVDLIGSISGRDNLQCTDITPLDLRAQRNHVERWTKLSLKCWADCMAACRLQSATLGVDGRLNHVSSPHAKCSRHHP